MLTGIAIFLFSLGVGLAITVRQSRVEYESDDRPSDLVLLARIGRSPLFLLTIAAVPVAMVLSTSAGVVAAVLVSAVLLVGAAVGARTVLHGSGIERQHLLVATSVAFLAMVATCGVWSMFEVFADAPLISMRVPWTVGIAVLVASLAVQRRRAA